jgi:hypothetical protein
MQRIRTFDIMRKKRELLHFTTCFLKLVTFFELIFEAVFLTLNVSYSAYKYINKNPVTDLILIN